MDRLCAATDTAGAPPPDALASIIHQVGRPSPAGGAGPGTLGSELSSSNPVAGAGRPVKADGKPANTYSPTDVAVTAPALSGVCSWMTGLLRACASACPCCSAEAGTSVSQTGRGDGRAAKTASSTHLPVMRSSAAGGQEALATASIAHGARGGSEGSSETLQRSVSTAGTPSAAATAAQADAAPYITAAHDNRSSGAAVGAVAAAAAVAGNRSSAPSPAADTGAAGSGGDDGANTVPVGVPRLVNSGSAAGNSTLAPPPPPPPHSTLAGFAAITIPSPHRHAISRKNPLLPPLSRKQEGKMCLVLDLDETLVHSNFKPVPGADLVVPVKLGPTVHPVHVMTRPGWQSFLEVLAESYELVVFTASVDYYANPLLDRLDPTGKLISHRLFRESCVFWQGNYIKDMSLLGRDERRSIIVDNSPASYLLHPQNALPCTSFFEDKADGELPRLCRFLAQLARRNVADVRRHLIEWSTFADGGLGEDDTDLEPMGKAASRP